MPGAAAPKQIEPIAPDQWAPPRDSRERFLRAARCEKVDHAPVWMMRQAGRVLPEYRELKKRYTFLDLVRTPELATEVTLQPLRRFSFDAAILFSDILVIPEALGQGYRFLETGGVEMDFRISSASDIARLDVSAVEERLQYVVQALQRIRRELGPEKALLGFAGAPWTLANYMIEGGSLRSSNRALQLLEEDPVLLQTLLEKLTVAVTNFLRMQIAAGADAVQIFDSNAGSLPIAQFETGSGQWIKRIVADLKGSVPVIVFARSGRDWNTLNTIGADVLGIDHDMTMTEARANVREGIALQGNLSPLDLVQMGPDEIRNRTLQIIEELKGRPGHIFNLGHGVPPEARLENIAAVVETVRQSGMNSRENHAKR